MAVDPRFFESFHVCFGIAATTASSYTSVGATSVRRFQRPVAFQDVPDAFLPAALRDGNPLRLPRRVNGRTRVVGQPVEVTDLPMEAPERAR